LESPPAGDGIYDLEIQLGHLCTNRCVFCCSGQRNEAHEAGSVPERELVAALEEAAARGIRRITLVGGEPTVHPAFLSVLRRATSLGFREIVVFTNGARLADRSFVEKAVALGALSWRVSVQGTTAEIHEAVTRRPGSFRRLVDGLAVLRRLGQRVTANTCLARQNAACLPDLPAFVQAAGADHLSVDVIRLRDTGRRTRDDLARIVPRYSEVAPLLDEMLAASEKLVPRLEVAVCNFPYCLVPEWRSRVHHDGTPAWVWTADGQSGLGQLPGGREKYDWQRAASQHTSACERCLLEADCRGLQALYLELYGSDELRPILEDAAAPRADRPGPAPPRVPRTSVPARVSRADIKVGFRCNNHCAFCVQGDKRKHQPVRSLAQIRADLLESQERGASAVVFTGGEPTIHEHILDAVRVARELGYVEVQMQTNGRRFAYPAFCRQAVEAGVTEFGLSLHGSTSELHDRSTEAPGSYEQTLRGIANLKRLGQRVITNSVVTSANYRDLPRLARLLVAAGVDQYQFAFVHVVGRAAENRSWLVPRKTDVRPHVHQGLDVGRRAGVVCMTEAIPYCFMAGYEEHVAERIIPAEVIFDADRKVEDYTRYRLEEGKLRGPRCPACAWFERCEGPWREYPELFGWDEFEPVVARPDASAGPAGR
jgi:MoaA/NifB/PqqE/SkfB family radical SAM enzyme